MSKTTKTRPSSSKDVGIKKGPWTPEEDEILANFVRKEGEGRWRILPKLAGLHRCGKSCRLRWMNYLRPSVKRGQIALDEEDLILRLHRLLGNRWALIAARIPGRTDNEIKNYWNTHISKKLIRQGIDPRTHKPLINNYTNTNSNTNTTVTTTKKGFVIGNSHINNVKQQQQDHESSSNYVTSSSMPPPQSHVMGLIGHYHEISTKINNVDEVPIMTQSRADGKVEYNQKKEDEEKLLLFLNSLVNDDDDEVIMSSSNNTIMFPSPPLSTLSSLGGTLADWEAEFSNALYGGGQYDSSPPPPSM